MSDLLDLRNDYMKLFEIVSSEKGEEYRELIKLLAKMFVLADRDPLLMSHGLLRLLQESPNIIHVISLCVALVNGDLCIKNLENNGTSTLVIIDIIDDDKTIIIDSVRTIS